MLRKSVLLTILSISFLSCDDDFKQGNCEEGFFQQDNFDGGFHCVPLGEEDAIDIK